MMRKLLIVLLVVVPLVTACSKDAANREMLAMVNSKEHDPRLFGWWKSLEDESIYYIYFDAITFKRQLFYVTESGALKQYENGWYWYTESGVLYLNRVATWKVGNIPRSEKYLLSDDGNTLTLRAGQESAAYYTKVDHP
ncbi:MAG: hypothetical protein IJQ93_02105 [Bacteroidales bacterium]|nr:hypothetical protein [Bacteroidales bacterium]